MTKKEENAIILEYLPYGYPLEGKMMPIAQAIGEGKRDKIYYILGRLPAEKLTENAKIQLEEFIANVVEEKEKQFVEFFNKATAINTRIHQIELLPGYGKKHMKEILKTREEKEFEGFDDMKKRIPSLPDPKTAVQKRIIKELTGDERHRLFVLS